MSEFESPTPHRHAVGDELRRLSCETTADQPVLVLIVERSSSDGLRLGQRFVAEVSPRPFVLGRSVGCDVTLNDSTVSRRHCQVTATDAGWRFENLSRRNGVFVDRERIGPGESHEVATFQEVQLGGVLLVAEFDVATVDFNSVVLSSDSQGKADALFHFSLDVEACAVQCRGRLMAMGPSASRAFAVLASSPGKVVHQWDIQEAVGTDGDLARLMSEIRTALRSLVEHEVLSLEDLTSRVLAAHPEDGAKLDDLGWVLRRFLHARRGHGYRVCLSPADVFMTDLR